MKNQREFTSLENSLSLQKVGVSITCDEEYYWQKITPTEYQKMFQDTGERFFVGKQIFQGSEMLYSHVDVICPAYTFQQLFDFLKVCPKLIHSNCSAVDQVATYIIQTRSYKKNAKQ